MDVHLSTWSFYERTNCIKLCIWEKKIHILDEEFQARFWSQSRVLFFFFLAGLLSWV